MADVIDQTEALLGDADAISETQGALSELVEWTVASFADGKRPASLAVALDLAARLTDGSSNEGIEFWRLARERKALLTGRPGDLEAVAQ